MIKGGVEICLRIRRNGFEASCNRIGVDLWLQFTDFVSGLFFNLRLCDGLVSLPEFVPHLLGADLGGFRANGGDQSLGCDSDS